MESAMWYKTSRYNCRIEEFPGIKETQHYVIDAAGGRHRKQTDWYCIWLTYEQAYVHLQKRLREDEERLDRKRRQFAENPTPAEFEQKAGHLDVRV